MLFNSYGFLLFFAVFFILYHGPAKALRGGQNWLILVGSYAFYAFAEWKVLPLLVVFTCIFLLTLTLTQKESFFGSIS